MASTTCLVLFSLLFYQIYNKLLIKYKQNKNIESTKSYDFIDTFTACMSLTQGSILKFQSNLLLLVPPRIVLHGRNKAHTFARCALAVLAESDNCPHTHIPAVGAACCFFCKTFVHDVGIAIKQSQKNIFYFKC